MFSQLLTVRLSRFALASVRFVPVFRTPATLAETSNTQTSASWCSPSPRATSDGSTGRCGSGQDRGADGGNSTCTSYFESSENDSANNCGGGERDKWRSVSGTATRDEKIQGHSFRLICAQGSAAGGADNAAEGGGGSGGGGSCSGRIWPAAAAKSDEESGLMGDSGIDTNSSSSDGIGESASVADITDALDCIGQASEETRGGGVASSQRKPE